MELVLVLVLGLVLVFLLVFLLLLGESSEWDGSIPITEPCAECCGRVKHIRATTTTITATRILSVEVIWNMVKDDILLTSR